MVEIEDYKKVCSSLVDRNFHGITVAWYKYRIISRFVPAFYMEISMDLPVPWENYMIINSFDLVMYKENLVDLPVRL